MFHVSKFFGISWNFISDEIPTGISQLCNLRTINLSYRNLSEIVPPSIEKLPELSCHRRVA
ncbi:RNI superfamily protein [Medicago truncatula]|uniref:RNI superfamily protein n=1 Tax=Medicago truncatula TaxID=3880 RepID=G7K750_MEDTR|nr:RNI superfamily protein [Medicago truncatula]